MNVLESPQDGCDAALLSACDVISDALSEPTRRPAVTGFFHAASNTVSYVVADPGSTACAIVDPVLDFDLTTGRTSTGSVDALLRFVAEAGRTAVWVLETHVHADHLSAAPYLRARFGCRLGIGSRICDAQQTFGDVFNLQDDCRGASGHFDQLFDDGERIEVGGLSGLVLHSPGHTPVCVAYVIGDAVFAGDTLFMPDYGTARADFPGGDASELYRSIRRLLALPSAARLFVCHDYKAPGREDFAWETTIEAQRTRNVHVREGVSEDDFVVMRRTRDAQLSPPRLFFPSVQVNIRGGALPPPEANGCQYLKIPLNRF